MYEKAKKEGKLNSISIFGGASLPWTNEAASKLNDAKEKELKFERGVAGKKLSPREMEELKKNLVKPIMKTTASKSSPTTVTEEPPKKKGLFGLF